MALRLTGLVIMTPVKNALPWSNPAGARFRPDPLVIEHNKILIDATYLHDVDNEDDDGCLEGPPLPLQRRIDAADFLLRMDTGPWSEDRIAHHCKLGCCQNAQESKLKLWVAIQARAIAGHMIM